MSRPAGDCNEIAESVLMSWQYATTSLNIIPLDVPSKLAPLTSVSHTLTRISKTPRLLPGWIHLQHMQLSAHEQSQVRG